MFTTDPFSGNPLAVVPDASGLSDAQMQRVTNEFNLYETSFVLGNARTGGSALGTGCLGQQAALPERPPSVTQGRFAEARPQRHQHQLRPVGRLQFQQDARDVVADRFGAHTDSA